MRRLFLCASAFALATGLSACGKKDEAETPDTPDEEIILSSDDTQTDGSDSESNIINALSELDANAPEADGTERFFGKKSFTIISEQSGVEVGTVTEHVRDWGRKRVEIRETKVSMAGFTQETNARVINIGAQIISVDGMTGRVTETTSPLYDAIVDRMKGKSGVEYGKEIMSQMGGKLTGEKGSFAGHDCEYWTLEEVNAKSCVTAWGGTLHTVVDMAGMSMEKTATEVRMNDGGPDAAFDYDPGQVQEAPDLQEIMKKMQQPG